RVALQSPGLVRAECHLLAQQFCQSRSGGFGDALDRRFAQSQPAEFLERDLSRLREAGLHAGDARHLCRRGREMTGGQTHLPITREATLATTLTMVIVSC